MIDPLFNFFMSPFQALCAIIRAEVLARRFAVSHAAGYRGNAGVQLFSVSPGEWIVSLAAHGVVFMFC